MMEWISEANLVVLNQENRPTKILHRYNVKQEGRSG